MSKLWSRGSWGRYLALFLAVVLALNTVSPAVKAEGFDQAEQAQEVQNETEVTNETEPAAEPTEENPDETDPAEEVTDEAPAEEDTEPAQEPTEEVTEPAETEPAEEATEEVTEPAEEPTEEATEPAETEPAEEPVETEPAAEPTEEITEPAETEPTEEPTEEVTEPSEEPTEDAADPAEEQADDNEELPELVEGTASEVQIVTPGESARLRFTAVNPTGYQFNYYCSESAETEVFLRIYDQNGTQIENAAGDGGGAYLYTQLTAGENYEIEVGFNSYYPDLPLTIGVEVASLHIDIVNDDEIVYHWEGNSAYLSVPIDCLSQPLFYEWARDGEILEGEYNSEIYVYDDGIYTCRVYDEYGNEAVYTVEVIQTPSWNPYINQDPTDLSYGDSVTMSVSVSSDDPDADLQFSYQWYYMDTETESWTLIEGATAAKYTTIFSEKVDYYCQVMDQYGIYRNVFVQLRINNYLSVIADKTDYYVAPGESVLLKAIVRAKDMEGLTCHWRRWTQSEGWIDLEEDSAALTVEGTTEQQQFELVVRDKYDGSQSIYFNVWADTIEISSTSPKYLPAVDGSTVTLKIDAASAYGDLQYAWSKYAEDDGEWTTLPYETGEAQLSVYNTSENYSDTSVQCVVSDGYTSKTISFKIRVLSNLTELTENEEFMARGDGLWSFFKFVPEETGVYSLVSTSSADNDPCCELWAFTDGDIESTAYSDNEDGWNFNLTEKLTAGQTYVFAIWSNWGDTDDIPVKLKTAEHYLVLDMPNQQYLNLEKGENAELEVSVATDSTELSYRWEKTNLKYEHQVQLDDVTGPSYTTNKPGIYYCYVSDENGNTVSAEFYVHLAYMPLSASADWSAGGDNLGIKIGGSAELNVVINESAGQDIYYEWYRNEELIEGATKSSYTASKVGSYSCYVTDDYGNEEPVNFYVYYDIEGDTLSATTSSPGYMVAKSGDTISLRIEASSLLGDVRYKWRLACDNYGESLPTLEDSDTVAFQVNAQWNGVTYYAYCTVADDYQEREFSFTISVYQNLTELRLDEETIISGGGTAYFIFTPEETFASSFASNVTGIDPNCSLYEIDESSMNNIGFDDDSGDGLNFIIKAKLVKGRQYLFEVRPNSSRDCPVILTKAEHYLFLDMESENTIYLGESETATLQPVLFTNSENLRYTWYHGNNSGSHMTLMEDVTGPFYETVKPGRYTVEIRDDYDNYAEVTYEVYLSFMPLDAYADGTSWFYPELGESVTLKVSIGNWAGQDVYYKWERNGKLIEGKSEASITTDKGGTFVCYVYDDYGNEVSVSFSVEYNITLNAWAEENYISVPYCGEAELKVIYEKADQDLFFRWLHDDEVIEENGTEVYRTRESGYYSCVVSDDYGNEIWVSFRVNVATADDWGTAGTTKPSYDGLVSYGGDVSFEVSLYNVDESAVFTYAWYQLPDFSVIDDSSKWTLIENETTSALTWKNITGKIYVVCLVTDPFGESKRVQRFEASVQNFLTVRAANDQQRFAVAEGESVTLEVLAYADDMEGLSYSWFELDKGSENVKWNELDNTGSSLTVTKIGATEQDYLCRVTDRFGSKEEVDFAVCSQNNLSVEAVNPYRFVEGGPETLEVVIHADDPEGITVTWYNEYGWPLEGTETTFAVEVYRNTIYSCRVKDRFGMEAWAYFERVTNKTWNLESNMLPENGKVNYGDSVSLSMDPVVIWYGTSSPNFTYRWYTTTNDQDETSWTELQEQGPYLTQTVTEHRFYKAVITDKFGLSEERIFDVTVENHLEIEDPEPETVAFGADVTFAAEVTADDTSEMSYVWYTMGETSGTSALQSVRTNDAQAGKVILSEDGPVYTAKDVTYYKTIYLDVTDKYGNTETAQFSCAVENHFTAEAENAVVKTSFGGEAELRVVYSADNAEGMTFEWYSPYGSYSSENSDRITVSEILDDAAYYCLVTDCYGTTIRVNFTVQVDHIWDAELQYQEVVPMGSTAKITVQLTGEYNLDEFRFNWRIGEGDEQTMLWYSIGADSNTIELPVMNPLYIIRCEVSDSTGITKTVEATIKGENDFSVSFAKGSTENIVPYGGEVAIEFEVSGNYLDNLHYSWLKYIEIGDYIEERDMRVSALSYTFTNITKSSRYKFTAEDGFGGRYETEFTISPESEPEVIYTLDKTALTISVGSQEKLTLVGSDGSVGTGTWTSSNEDVASVNENGLVTAKAVGKTTITVKIGDYTGTCEVTVLFKDVAGSPVKDDPDYQYYYAPVYWAADNGITVGYSDGTFGVGKDCQRRELMIFLWRFAGEPTKDKNGKAYGDARTMFNDLKGYGTSTATNKAIAWAYKEGITKGYNDGGFHPTDSIVRKDVMIMLYRLAGKPSVSGSLKFTDCQGYNKTSDTYKAILWGSKNKITNGYTSGEYAGQFGVNLNCLREQIVTFLYRYNNLP